MNRTAARLRQKTMTVAWIATALLSYCMIANAAASSLDRVVAVVNKDVILDSQVQQLARRLQASGSSETDSNVLLQQALNSLISEKLQLQAASRAGINPDNTSIDRAVNSVAASNNLSLDQFKQALQKRGIDYQSFRNNITSQLIINSLKQRRSNQNSTVTDQEINDLITAESRQITANRSYHIQDLFIPAPKNADIASFNQAKRNAIQLRGLALSGPDFMKAKVSNR